MFRRRRGQREQQPEREVCQVRERVADIGDDYWIETTSGWRAFKVNGKVLGIRDTFAIERPGKPDAAVKKAVISPLRDRWVLEADDVGEIRVQATSSTTSTPSRRRTGGRSPRRRSAGCACGTRTASRSIRRPMLR